jgi:hypothetical protein
VSKEIIEAIEREIDRSFASNALKNEGYAQAVWTLLSMTEEYLLKIFNQQPADLEVFTDTHMNALTYPLRVCHTECAAKGKPLVSEYIPAHYQLAWDWLKLARHGYFNFHALFPLWHRGRLDLAVEGKRLVVKTPPQDKTYEAYNRLVPKDARGDGATDAPAPDFDALVAPKTSRGKDWFRVNFDPRLVADLINAITPVSVRQHSLPGEWAFSCFTLGQFRAVATTLQAMMMGWFTARNGLAAAGMPGMGYRSSVYVTRKDELAARLRRYTGIELMTVCRILELLTFGSSNIRYPDIAVQPLIDLRNGNYALSPFVWTGVNPERNFCTLLNQIPEHRKIYSRLVNEKESLLRKAVEEFLRPLGLETRSGQVDGTDLDIAILDRKNQCCLCLELKWFIEPAEIREIEEKTQELRKGVTQAKKLRALYEQQDWRLLREVLDIRPDYALLTAVATQNWIGHAEAQDDEVPIIKIWHLLCKIRDTGSLRIAMEWLSRREYLPIEGTDFAVHPMDSTCGEWTCEWYGIKTLQ